MSLFHGTIMLSEVEITYLSFECKELKRTEPGALAHFSQMNLQIHQTVIILLVNVN